MRHTRWLLLLCYFILSLQSCSTKTIESDLYVQSISALAGTRAVVDLEPYIVDTEILPVAEDEIVFSGISKMIVGDYYFFLSGGVVYRMCKDGNNIVKVGNVGRGPGEYVSIKDLAFSQDGKELWCMDALNSILRYDASTLEYIGQVSMNIEDGYARAIIPLSNNHFALYYPNPSDSDLGHDNINFYCLKEYDLCGKEIRSSMKWSGFNAMAAFSVPMSFSDNHIGVLAPESSSSALVFENGTATKVINFDFGNKTIPANYFKKEKASPWALVSPLFESDYYKLISCIFILKDDVYFRAFGEQSSLWNFYTTNSADGIRWQSIGESSPPIFPIAVEDGFLIFQFDDYGLRSLDDEPDPLKRYIIKKHGLPRNRAMTYLIKVKFNV